MQNIQLSIPTPCHENWNNMTPSQQGRFCNACAKQVVDFSSMSDKDVLNYFSTVKDKEVCGRAFPQQLERTIQINPDKPKRFYHRYLNYAALLLLFFKAGHIKAQGKVAVKPLPKKPVKQLVTGSNSPLLLPDIEPYIRMGGMITLLEKPVDKASVKSFTGNVTDEDGAPIPFATVEIEATGQAVTTDSTGRFLMKNLNANDVVTVSAVGYNDTAVVINQPAQIIILTKKEVMLKEVVVEGFATSRRSSMTGAIISRITCYKVKDSLIDRIMNFNPAVAFNPSVSIYPNPVVKGNMLHVSVNFKKEGQYSLQICDAAGRQVFQQSIQATTKNYLIEMVAEKSWGTGMFIIRIADAKNNVVKTDRFIAL